MKRVLLRTRAMRLTSIAMLLSGAVACASSTALEEALEVTALAPQYQRDSLGMVAISYRVSNAGGDAVYLETCGGAINAALDQRVSSTVWIESTSAIGLCYSSFSAGPYRLEPGASVQAVQTARPAPGVYRLSVPVATSPTAASDRHATSGAIRII